MLRKIALGLVAASLSAMALAPTAASAHGFGGGMAVVTVEGTVDGITATTSATVISATVSASLMSADARRWRLLCGAPRADPVRLPPADGRRLRLIQPPVSVKKPRLPSGRGFCIGSRRGFSCRIAKQHVDPSIVATVYPNSSIDLPLRGDKLDTLMTRDDGHDRKASEEAMLDRREIVKRVGAGLALGATTGLNPFKAFALDSVTLPFDNGERPLVKYPQKRPMIGQTSRPPQLETPFSVFNEGPITPNDAFFVRYHLADIPLDIDPDTFTLEIKGKVDHPLKLSLKDIKKMKATEIVAVTQCSGNSRGFSNPRVAGGQSGNGAMGNARWRGVPLKAVLERRRRAAGCEAGGVWRHGRPGQRQDAGFRQGARHRSRARRRSDAGVSHERTGICRF